jgi:seryl-tRNA synthetase
LNFYNARVLDIKLIRERPDFVRARLATRGAGDETKIDEILKLDEQRRIALTKVESLKSERNRVSKEIGALMGQKEFAKAEARKAETKDLGDIISHVDKQIIEVESARDALMLQLPNLPHESVPAGKSAEDNPEVRLFGEKATFAFKPKSHVELCESLKLVDFARAAKLSGSGFLLYTNWGARLERALIQFLLDLHISQHGYTEVSPPFVVNKHTQCVKVSMTRRSANCF